MTSTIMELFERRDIEIPIDLIGQVEVPVLCGPQRQGDVGIFPRSPIGKDERAGMSPVPNDGVAVVRGEAGGNTHWLLPGGDVYWQPHAAGSGEVLLGVLHVDQNATAYLIHEEEHGCNAIGPGTYTLHGKREMASEIRRVAD